MTKVILTIHIRSNIIVIISSKCLSKYLNFEKVFIEWLESISVLSTHLYFNLVAPKDLQLLRLQQLLLSYLASKRVKIEIVSVSWLFISMKREGVEGEESEGVASDNGGGYH